MEVVVGDKGSRDNVAEAVALYRAVYSYGRRIRVWLGHATQVQMPAPRKTGSRLARHRREIALRIAAEVAPKETRTVVFTATKVFVCFK